MREEEEGEAEEEEGKRFLPSFFSLLLFWKIVERETSLLFH